MKKLSIIIVTYNASFDLERTLESVFNQTFVNFELVIIDCESTDNTLEIVKKYEDKIDYWISEADSGIYDAMNKGLKVAKGEYVQFLNAGDFLVDENVLQQIFCDLFDSPTLIYGDINILHTDGGITKQVASDFTMERLLARGTGVLCHQAMFVRRESSPIYNLKYKFKGELNWYFDIVESNGFTFRKRDTTVVTYTLGGFGHQHFVRNRIDWLRVIYDRYGITTIRESKILSFLWHNSFYRYPWLGKVHRAVTAPIKSFMK